MARPKVYPDVETYRKEYNSRPKVKERNKIHNIKWKSKPEVRQRLREYQREYMKSYWLTHPEKYKKQKVRIAELNRTRIDRKKQFQNIV